MKVNREGEAETQNEAHITWILVLLNYAQLEQKLTVTTEDNWNTWIIMQKEFLKKQHSNVPRDYESDKIKSCSIFM